MYRPEDHAEESLSPQRRHRPAQRRRRSITNACNTVEERRFSAASSAPRHGPIPEAKATIVKSVPPHHEREKYRGRAALQRRVQSAPQHGLIPEAKATIVKSVPPHHEREKYRGRAALQRRVQHQKRDRASAPMYRPEDHAEESETTEEIVTLSPQRRHRPAQRRRRFITNACNTVEERRFSAASSAQKRDRASAPVDRDSREGHDFSRAASP